MMANGVRFSRFHEQDERKRVSALDKYDCPSGGFVHCAMTVWSVKTLTSRVIRQGGRIPLTALAAGRIVPCQHEASALYH